MGKEISTFSDNEIEKKEKNFHPILLKYVDIEKVLVSNKISLVKKNYKYFIG